jgi:hypothetical protein
MGSKRKENYDDWWRCEVSFDPRLDELFGVTHSKQGVAPTRQLQEMISPDMESTARVLNTRVRKAFESIKDATASRAAHLATRQDFLLPPLKSTLSIIMKSNPQSGRTYSVRSAKLRGRAFFEVADVNGRLTITMNVNHPFFERVYGPLLAAKDHSARFLIECLIIANARAEAAAVRPAEQNYLQRHRAHWGDALVAFLEGKV